MDLETLRSALDGQEDKETQAPRPSVGGEALQQICGSAG